MHTIHHTEAFVLRSTEHGEANKHVWLFTREFGLVIAAVQGVRKQGAKLQMHLIEYAHVAADLVRGRDTWRLVSVTLGENPLHDRLESPFARGYVRTLSLLSRFLNGEDPHPELFAHLQEVSLYLTNHTEGSARAYDTLALWRALAYLGYIAVEERDTQLSELSFTDAMEAIDDATVTRLIGQSNAAITESQL